MKHMTMPDVKIVRFDTNDVIVTSQTLTAQDVTEGNIVSGTQGRNSLWD